MRNHFCRRMFFWYFFVSVKEKSLNVRGRIQWMKSFPKCLTWMTFEVNQKQTKIVIGSERERCSRLRIWVRNEANFANFVCVCVGEVPFHYQENATNKNRKLYVLCVNLDSMCIFTLIPLDLATNENTVILKQLVMYKLIWQKPKTKV